MFNIQTKNNRDKDFINNIQQDFNSGGLRSEKKEHRDKLAKSQLKRTEKQLNNFNIKNSIKFNNEITSSKASLLDRSQNHSNFTQKPNKTLRIQESVESNKILSVEPFWMDKKMEFRERSVDKEIQPSMKYKTSNAFYSMIDNVDQSYKLKNGLTDKEIVKKLNMHIKNEILNQLPKEKDKDDNTNTKADLNRSLSSNFQKDKLNELNKLNKSVELCYDKNQARKIIHSTPTFKRKIINDLQKDYKSKNQIKMMEEVANGIILHDLKNFEQDSKINNIIQERKIEEIDKGLLGKFINIKINKMKGWSPINDKEGQNKAKLILASTNQYNHSKK